MGRKKMHEAQLAANIFDIAKGEMKKLGKQKLNKIFIDIGEFTHIDPESLSFAFEILADDSDLKGARLEIKRIPLILGCRDCGSEFSGDDMVFICPKCGSKAVEVLKGREFRITELEVDDEDQDS